MVRTIFFGVLVLTLVAASPALAARNIDFGDDTGEYSNDGECDDPRFEGAGMTGTALLSDDMLHDATDCRTAYEDGKLTLRGVAEDGTIDFGDDSGEYSRDGECDDLRFAGPGMTGTTLIQDDIMHDATDCRTAYDEGQLKLRLK